MSEDSKPIELPDSVDLQEIENEIEEVDPDALEDISPEKKGQLLRAISILQSTSHSGPLPSPDDLKKYDVIIPNGADRIMIMAERQNQHRIDIEKSIIKSNNTQSGTGQWMGFILGLGCICASVYLGVNNQPWLGGVLGGSTIIGLVTVFVLGRKAQKEED